jgi:serine/threonine protein kinase
MGYSDHPPCLLMRKYQGSLQTLIDKSLISMKQAVKFLKDIALAVNEIHSKNIIHLDIKPLNILVDFDSNDEETPMRAIVTDFGFSVAIERLDGLRMIASGLSIPESYGVTVCYAAPEVTQIILFHLVSH